MHDDEKWSRVKKSAKHFLAAVVFNESSSETLYKIKSPLLACIGYYYVGFHSAIAMLWLCRSISAKSLYHVRHNQLKKLMEVNLIQTKKLARSFLTEHKQLTGFP